MVKETGRDPEWITIHFYDTDEEHAARGGKLLKDHLPEADNVNTGLPLALMDFIEYAVNPQVHASDLASIVETLPAQSATVQTAKALSRGLPVHISAVTLKGRINPYAVDDEAVRRSQDRESQTDPRLKSLFVAGWTLGSIAHLSAENARSVNFYEGIGALGMIDEGGQNVSPVYHVIAEIGELSGGGILKLEGLDSTGMTGIAIKKDEHLRLIVANLTDEEIETGIDTTGWNWGTAQIRTMQEENYSAMLTDKHSWLKTYDLSALTAQPIPVRLPPFSLVFIDFKTFC